MSLRSLEGRRVLELGSYIASPYAGHLLSHLGAEVIKVEPLDGDPTRALFHGAPGGTFIAFSHGKRSVAIDLASAEGLEVFHSLVASAAILVHNLAPEAVRKLRVSHEDCHRINPELVYCQIVGYGPGPRANEKVTNPLVEAATGIMAQHRVDGRPTRLGPSYFDLFAGSNAVIGILSALVSPQTTMRRIEVALYETGLHISSKEIVGSQLESRAAPAGAASKAGHEFGLPGYGTYLTRDGRWIHLLMLSDSHWSKFCRALDVSYPEQMRTLKGRQLLRAEAEALVASAMSGRDYAQVAARLNAAGCKFTEVLPVADALRDPQALCPGKTYLVHLGGAEYAMPALPMRSESPAVSPHGEVPRLGEHTLDILRSLNYTAVQCQALIARGAVKAAA